MKYMTAATLLAGASGVLAAPASWSTTDTKKVFFSLIREGEGPDGQNAIGITNLSGRTLYALQDKVAVGHVSANGEEKIIPLDTVSFRYRDGTESGGGPGSAQPANYAFGWYRRVHLFEGEETRICGFTNTNTNSKETTFVRRPKFWGDENACDFVLGPLTSFNEKDALKLYVGGEVVDVFGDPANPERSDVCGHRGGTKDYTLVRKSSVTAGNTEPLASFGTDPTDCEWIVKSDEFVRTTVDERKAALPLPEKTPFFDIIREGPGNQKAFAIRMPVDSDGNKIDIRYGRLAVGRKSKGDRHPEVFNLGYRRRDMNEAAKKFTLYCDKSGVNSWWGDYDVCDVTFQPLTEFTENDTLTLYLDGVAVDVVGSEDKDAKTTEVCGSKGGISGNAAGRTLVRKVSVNTGNPVPLASFGTSPSDCEWVIREGDTLLDVFHSAAPHIGKL